MPSPTPSTPRGRPSPPWMEAGTYPNRFTSLENLALSQTVILQFTFCRKRRFMKPLLLCNVATFSCPEQL